MTPEQKKEHFHLVFGILNSPNIKVGIYRKPPNPFCWGFKVTEFKVYKTKNSNVVGCFCADDFEPADWSHLVEIAEMREAEQNEAESWQYICQLRANVLEGISDSQKKEEYIGRARKNGKNIMTANAIREKVCATPSSDRAWEAELIEAMVQVLKDKFYNSPPSGPPLMPKEKPDDTLSGRGCIIQLRDDEELLEDTVNGLPGRRFMIIKKPKI